MSGGAANSASTDTIHIETDAGFSVFSRNNRETPSGAAISFSVRPEAVRVFPQGWDWQGENRFDGRITEKVYLGDVTELELTLAEENSVVSRVQSRLDQEFGFKKGDPVSFGWNAEDCNFLSD